MELGTGCSNSLLTYAPHKGANTGLISLKQEMCKQLRMTAVSALEATKRFARDQPHTWYYKHCAVDQYSVNFSISY
jgi:hypothetical protein